MSLDVYVMPLCRFKAGDVRTASQRALGRLAHIVNPFGLISPKRIKRLEAMKQGRAATAKLLAEAESMLGVPLQWADKGDVVFAEQASWGFQALQAYAKWLDLQDVFPTFGDPPDNNFYKHPAMLWSEHPRAFRFSHLIDHCCHTGYFVPCRFDRVIMVEPFEGWGGRVFHHSVGSSFTLADQLEAMRAYLPAEKDVSETAHQLIHAGFNLLKTTASKSIEHQLPIIFWG